MTVSRASARELRARGVDARCLADVAAAVGEPADLEAEVRRIEETYDMPHIRDVYRADWACGGQLGGVVRRPAPSAPSGRSSGSSTTCGRTSLVPEVGNETIRVAAHLIGLRRGIPVLFLLYTIFPNPLRLYVDTLHAPIAGPTRCAS